MAQSIFEKIVAGEIPCHRLYEDEHVLAFLDVGPISRGHCLLIPKAGYVELDAVPAEVAAALGRAMPRLVAAVKTATGCAGVNVLQNNGVAAGQAVMHVHFHLIPRYASNPAPAPGSPPGNTPRSTPGNTPESTSGNPLKNHSTNAPTSPNEGDSRESDSGGGDSGSGDSGGSDAGGGNSPGGNSGGGNSGGGEGLTFGWPAGELTPDDAASLKHSIVAALSQPPTAAPPPP